MVLRANQQAREKRSRTTLIIRVNFHPKFQQIASVDTETGEFREKRFVHRGDAETFFREAVGQKVRVETEASGHARWFERLVTTLQLTGKARIGQEKLMRLPFDLVALLLDDWDAWTLNASSTTRAICHQQPAGQLRSYVVKSITCGGLRKLHRLHRGESVGNLHELWERIQDR